MILTIKRPFIKNIIKLETWLAQCCFETVVYVVSNVVSTPFLLRRAAYTDLKRQLSVECKHNSKQTNNKIIVYQQLCNLFRLNKRTSHGFLWMEKVSANI